LIKTIVQAFIFLANDKISQEGMNCLADLEEKVLQSTRDFYKLKASSMIAESSLVDYFKVADLHLKDEESRLERYFTWANMDVKILKEFQQEVLVNY